MYMYHASFNVYAMCFVLIECMCMCDVYACAIPTCRSTGKRKTLMLGSERLVLAIWTCSNERTHKT